MAIAPDCRSTPMIGRTRKSPRSYSGRFSSITRPTQDTRASKLTLVLGQRRDHLAEPLHRGLACELADHVGLRPRDGHLRAHGTGALRDAGHHVHPKQPHGHRPIGVDLAVAEEDSAAGEGGARQPAEHRHVRPGPFHRRQELLRREAEWVAERDQGLVGSGLIGGGGLREGFGQTEQAEALRISLGRHVDGLELGPGQRGGPDHDPGRLLELMAPGDGAAGAAADQGPRLEALVHLGEQPLRHAEVMTGGEDDGQVAGRIEAGSSAIGRLRRGLDRVEALGGTDRGPHRRGLRRGHASRTPPSWRSSPPRS